MKGYYYYPVCLLRRFTYARLLHNKKKNASIFEQCGCYPCDKKPMNQVVM